MDGLIFSQLSQQLVRFFRKSSISNSSINSCSSSHRLTSNFGARLRYSIEDTGTVSSIACTPDNSAFAVGWKLRALTVWSLSGCRLMSTIHQIGLSYISSPVSYMSQNRPILHITVLMDGTFLTVAGLHGLILYHVRTKKWRLFGDITQEQQIQFKGLLWLGKVVVVCNYVESSDSEEPTIIYSLHHRPDSKGLCVCESQIITRACKLV